MKKLKSNSGLKQYLAVILAFGLIGGVYFVFKSHAQSVTNVRALVANDVLQAPGKSNNMYKVYDHFLFPSNTPIKGRNSQGSRVVVTEMPPNSTMTFRQFSGPYFNNIHNQQPIIQDCFLVKEPLDPQANPGVGAAPNQGKSNIGSNVTVSSLGASQNFNLEPSSDYSSLCVNTQHKTGNGENVGLINNGKGTVYVYEDLETYTPK